MTIQRPFVATEFLTWGANGRPSAVLESAGAITRIELEIELVPSATLTGANQPDGLNRLVRNLQLEGDGHTYFSLPDEIGCQGGTILRQLNEIDGFGVGHGNGAITAPARTFTGVRFVLHAGCRPRHPGGYDNPYDLSSFIPAGLVKTLRLTWSTAGNNILDDTVTITSAVGRIGINVVRAQEGRDAAQDFIGEMTRQGVWPHLPGGQIVVPQWLGQSAAIPGTSTAHEAQGAFEELTTGCFLKRFTVLAQDATATRPARAGDEIASIKIWADNGAPVYEKTAEMIQSSLPKAYNVEADDAAEDFQGGARQGIYPIDFRPMAHPLYGFNLLNTQKTWRVGYIHPTNASGDWRLSLQERYVPVAYSHSQLAKIVE